MSSQQLTISVEKILLIADKKICPVLDCYKILTGWEVKKGNKFCFEHLRAHLNMLYHCARCGTPISHLLWHRPRDYCDDCIKISRYRKRQDLEYEQALNFAHDIMRESKRKRFLDEVEDET